MPMRPRLSGVAEVRWVGNSSVELAFDHDRCIISNPSLAAPHRHELPSEPLDDLIDRWKPSSGCGTRLAVLLVLGSRKEHVLAVSGRFTHRPDQLFVGVSHADQARLPCKEHAPFFACA